MSFWVYENWTVEAGGKAIIHRGDCPFCNHGRGIHPNSSDRNGTWHGQFSTENDAMTYARGLNRRTVSRCRFCNR